MSYSPEQVGEQVRIAARAAKAREPGKLAAAITILLDNDNWRAYIDPADHRKHQWEDFRMFVLQRLGTTPEGLVGALNHAPGLAARVADLATGRQGVEKLDSHFSPLNVHTALGGLRQLRKHGHDDLADRVEAGELTVNAARIEAGLTRPRITISLEPERAARTIRRYFNADQLETLVAELRR